METLQVRSVSVDVQSPVGFWTKQASSYLLRARWSAFEGGPSEGATLAFGVHTEDRQVDLDGQPLRNGHRSGFSQNQF